MQGNCILACMYIGDRVKRFDSIWSLISYFSCVSTIFKSVTDFHGVPLSSWNGPFKKKLAIHSHKTSPTSPEGMPDCKKCMVFATLRVEFGLVVRKWDRNSQNSLYQTKTLIISIFSALKKGQQLFNVIVF